MSRKKILVVEDEENLLKLERILLTSQGYEVRGVASAKATFVALAEGLPDLILLDLMLPDMNGFRLCRRIKENPETRHIPVIMVTAYKSREDRVRGEQAGADGYITKPFKSAMLIETIQRFLGK